MHTILIVLLVLALIGVLTVLGLGMATLARGGNPQRSNKLMQARVMFQALALVLLAILMMMAAR
jgi:ABC-type Na+ efflux pump permease subunit